MIKLVAITLMTFTLCTANAQSKREQIKNLNYKVDSLKEIMTNERQIFKREIIEKGIKIKALQDQIDQLNLSFKQSTYSKKRKKLILENEYSLTSDSINILKQQIIKLNRNNSSNAIRNSSEFEPFLNYFLSTVYSEKNIDSLIYVSSPLFMAFVDQKIGFGRFYNIGATCNLYNYDINNGFRYNFYEDYFGETAPKISNLSFFKNQIPEGGFCQEASSQNGVYYKNVSNLPEGFDMEKGESIPPPIKFKHSNKILVQVQFDHWIAKTFYFVELNNKWFLLYINDCDCSA